jgi:hypothetical protein
MKRLLSLLFSISLCLGSSTLFAAQSSGLEINNAETLELIYAIEPEDINQSAIEAIISDLLANSGVQLAQRQDGQLHLRVEEHANRYLLYLDFSRMVRYQANGRCYSKAGFVWGRYAKDIADVEQLHEDIEFLFDEFLSDYLEANTAD